LWKKKARKQTGSKDPEFQILFSGIKKKIEKKENDYFEAKDRQAQNKTQGTESITL